GDDQGKHRRIERAAGACVKERAARQLPLPAVRSWRYAPGMARRKKRSPPLGQDDAVPAPVPAPRAPVPSHAPPASRSPREPAAPLPVPPRPPEKSTLSPAEQTAL